MPVTTRAIANVGSPLGDPGLLLPGILFIPDSSIHPPPWPCVVGWVSGAFLNSYQLSPLVRVPGAGGGSPGIFWDLAAAGFMCLAHYIRLAPAIPETQGGPLHGAIFGTGQLSQGIYPAQSNDCKIGIRAMRSNPFGFGYDVTGWVAAFGGSASADHAIFCGIDGTIGDDKADAAVGFSPPTEYSDRSSEALLRPDFIAWTRNYVYGNPNNPPDDGTVLAHLLAVSSISLPLDNACPILHYNGSREPMPITQQSDFAAAILASAAAATYEQHTNIGQYKGIHSFAQWQIPGVGGLDGRAIAWLLEQLPPPSPGQLHACTFTPSSSPDPSTDTVIACEDVGSHIFYTLADDPPGPVDPSHTGDAPVLPTIRIGSNSGTVNSGLGIKRFKALAYKSGSLDSDISVSGPFGSATPPPNLKPILTGWGQLLPGVKPGQPLPADIASWLCWTKPWIDFVRYRVTWGAIEAVEGTYDWTDLDTIIALCQANGKFLSFSVASGINTPQWVYDAGAFKYGPIHQSGRNQGLFQSLHWDPVYQEKWFTLLGKIAEHIAGLDILRAIIPAGFMQEVGMAMGDEVDETLMPFLPFGFNSVHDAYRTGAQAVLATTFSLFPNVGHAITYEQVWPDDQHKDTNFVRDWFRSTYPDRAGTIVTSMRAILPPHAPPEDSDLSAYPSYCQQFRNMTVPTGDNHYTPSDPVPLPAPFTCLQDCLEHVWSTGKQYGEIYRADVEFEGVDALFTVEREKIIANLLPPEGPPPPPQCPPGQHYDPDQGKCVPDAPPPPQCPPGQHYDPDQGKCVDDVGPPPPPPPPPSSTPPRPILENAKLGSDLDCQNHYILNLDRFLPTPEGLLDTNDSRLSDARNLQDGSVDNDAIAWNALIQQSKLDFSGVLPHDWIGRNPNQAANGIQAEYLVNKGQPDGYLPLRNDGTFNPGFLASTGPEAGTVLEVDIRFPDNFQVSNPVTTSGSINVFWNPVPNNTWFGINGGLGLNSKLIPSFLSGPVPLEIVPDLDASKVTSGTFNPELLPVAASIGVDHAVGLLPDTGPATSDGFSNDYLGRDMQWRSFVAQGNIQPTAPSPSITVLGYHGTNANIRINTALKNSGLFYQVGTDFYVKAPKHGITISVAIGQKLSSYVAKPGYNNSQVALLVVSPQA